MTTAKQPHISAKAELLRLLALGVQRDANLSRRPMPNDGEALGEATRVLWRYHTENVA